jgi:hypothetical protein
MDDFNWTSVLKLGVTAGLFSSLFTTFLTLFVGWLRDERRKKAEATYLALRLAVTLESYASACAHFIEKNADMEPPPSEEFPAWEVKLPELPPYPDDADGWRAIDCALAGQCLNLRNKIHGSQSIIHSTINYCMDDLGDTLDEQAAARGIEAWKLAAALRQKHGVEEADTVWDYAAKLGSTLRTAEESKRERQKRNAFVLPLA